MSIKANPFNHADLRDSLMIEWNELTSFEDYRQRSKNCRNVLYGRPNDILALHSSLLLLQRRFEGLQVGGKSALDWYGVRQYVSQQPVLHLYGWTAARLPEWFTERFPAE
jgi:hypothetical protein